MSKGITATAMGHVTRPPTHVIRDTAWPSSAHGYWKNTHTLSERTAPLTALTHRRRQRQRGIRSLLLDRSGVVDLGSVVVGVVVTSILSLGVTATVFGVIPWSQDNAAQQSVATVSSAQGVASNKSGRFLSGDGLVAGGYLQKGSAFATDTDGQGDCFVTVATSGSGKVFYNSNKAPDPAPLTASTKSPCLTGLQLQGLVDATGGKTVIAPETYSAFGAGANDSGQLGNNTTTPSVDPAAILTAGMAPAVITAVSAGPAHSCATTAASKIYCWGGGLYYRLGQGTSTANSLVPVAVTDSLLAGKKLTSLSAGDLHSCVVAGAQPYCWGGNTWGQLGNNSTTNQGRTVLVPGFTGKTVTAVSAGYASSCAVADAELWCWGGNITGRLGTGNTTDSLVPVKVGGLLAGKSVTEVAVGRNQACAIADGDAYCWGTNSNGQLGNGNTTNSLSPAKVTGLPADMAAAGLTTGTTHSCATVEGTAYCWGGNSAGQLGIGTNADSTKAMPVKGALRGKTVTMVSAGLDNTTTGASHTCALAADKVYCWGENVNGELGNGGAVRSNVPVAAVSQDKRMTAVAAGGAQTISVGVPFVP